MNKASASNLSSLLLPALFVLMLAAVKVPQGFSMEISVPYAVISVDAARLNPVEVQAAWLKPSEAAKKTPVLKPGKLTNAEKLLLKLQRERAIQEAFARSA